MNYTDAYRALGYTLGAPRLDWSAEKRGGVCLTVWDHELQSGDGEMSLDTKRDCEPLEVWQSKASNTKRILHIKTALKSYKGRVDVVIAREAVKVPEPRPQTAQPWLKEGAREGTYWQITDFEPETGHFVLTMEKG